MYRHPGAISIDLSLCKPLSLEADMGFISDGMIKQIEDYKLKHLKNFDISYDKSGGFIYLDFEGRGTIDDLVIKIMSFLNFCAKSDVYISSCAPYHMSWGDYESGSIFFNTGRDNDDNKAVITGISCHGEVVVKTIPWQY